MTRFDYIRVFLGIVVFSCVGIFLSPMIPQPAPLPAPAVVLPTPTVIPVTPIAENFDFLPREKTVRYQDDTGHTLEVSNTACISLIYGCADGFSFRHNFAPGETVVSREVALYDCLPDCVVEITANLKFKVRKDSHNNLQVFPPVGWKRR